jgi:hypothetical protein
MSITNEHILIIFLVLYLSYELYTKDEQDIVETIPEYNFDKIKDNKDNECKLPDKKTAQCVADMLVSTGCVRCSLEKCDKNNTISKSCYKDEEHSCDKIEEKTCSTKSNLFENIQQSMHDNEYNDMHKSYLNSTYETPQINNNIPLCYNDNGDNNNFENLVNGNSTILNNIYSFDNQQCSGYKDIGLERSLDGSFFKYSRLG